MTRLARVRVPAAAPRGLDAAQIEQACDHPPAVAPGCGRGGSRAALVVHAPAPARLRHVESRLRCLVVRHDPSPNVYVYRSIVVKRTHGKGHVNP